MLGSFMHRRCSSLMLLLVVCGCSLWTVSGLDDAFFVPADLSDPVVNKTAEAFVDEYALFLSDVFAVVPERTVLETLVYKHPLAIRDNDGGDLVYEPGFTYKLLVMFKVQWDSPGFRATPFVTVAECIYVCVEGADGNMSCEGKQFSQVDRHDLGVHAPGGALALSYIKYSLTHAYDNARMTLTAYETQDDVDLVEYVQFQVEDEPVKCEGVIYTRRRTVGVEPKKLLYFDDACIQAKYNGLSLDAFEHRQRTDIGVFLVGLALAASVIAGAVVYRRRILAGKGLYRSMHIRFGGGETVLVQEAPFKSVQSPAAAAVVTTSALSSQPSFRGEKIRLDLSLQWANNFGIQLAMFLYFVGALAVTIVIPSLGYKVEVGLLAGGSVTILSTAAVLYTYSVMPTWKKHPNPLIFYRSLFDMGFVLVLMTTQLYKYVNPVSPCHHLEYFELGVLLRVDHPLLLWRHRVRPSPRLPIHLTDDGGGGGRVICFAWQRLKGGLAETLRVRLRVLHSVTVYVVAIIIYWAITFGVYVPYLALGLVNNPTDYPVLPQVMVFFITCKGYFDFFVWFQINELPSGKQQPSTATSAVTAAAKVDVDVDLSPQVNQALRAEVLYYTTTGIIQAAHLAASCSDDVPKRELQLTPQGATGAGTSTTLFVDYAPATFGRIRTFYHVSTDSYVTSLLKTTKERLSEGASGAFMFFSEDQQLIVKSMSEGEASFLQSIASDYAAFLITHPESLLTRFLGCHSVHLYGTTFYFVVMSNLFSDHTKIIHRRYDIKGSWVNRSAKQPTKGKKVTCRHCNGKYVFGSVEGNVCPLRVGTHEPNVILKDNDLTQKVRLDAAVAEDLYDQIKKDAGFLCNHGIMDYSLLMGVHNVEYRVSADLDLGNHHLDNSLLLNTNITRGGSAVVSAQPTARNLNNTGLGDGGSDGDDTGDVPLDDDLHMDARMPLKFTGTRKANTVVGPACYYFGIIDILQLWNFDKKLERNTKVLLLRRDPDGLSALPPTKYKDRFCSKMADILRVGVHDEAFKAINMWEEAEPSSYHADAPAFPATQDQREASTSNKRLYL
ncbi:hypothetical protein DYB34_001934 [Aphanomyces astaci]|uniref:PIPK domain-containing protein n=3 Tax=Aphanomyces astaci TaxID=112090 RepID=A0A397A6S1_APHAT|nr:hypothetical protein DYB36_002927 [Aphanomyces astaci]RHY39046.1 hypothetical protein DYB34_001934 [Aphanomyces astaci]